MHISLRDWVRYSVSGCAVLLSVWMVGCSSYGPTFDPYAQETSAGLDQDTNSFAAVTVPGNQIPTEWLKPSGQAYRIGPGDELLVELIGVSNSTASTFVTPDGKLYYENLCGVRVRGLTLSELKDLLDKELAKWYNTPQVSVSLTQAKSQRFMITGRVTTPGVYSLDHPTTLIDAISQAGGVASGTLLNALQNSSTTAAQDEMADLSRAFMVRDGKFVPVDFDALLRQGDMRQNVYLQDGDYVSLPAIRSREVYVMGAVLVPRAVQFHDSISLIAAIAAAGGPAKVAHIQHIVVIRGSLTQPKVAVVAYKDIVTGKARDMVLQAHDIVWVPRTPWERLDNLVHDALSSFVRTVAVNEGARFGAPGTGTIGTSINVGGSSSP